MPQSPAEDGRLRDAASAAGVKASMSASALSAYSDAVQAAAGNELDRSAYRMLAAVLAATVDHDRTECVTGIDELAVVAKLSRTEATEALAELRAAGILSCDNIRNGAPGKVHIAVALNDAPVPEATALSAPPTGVPATLPAPATRDAAAPVTARPAPVRRRGRFRRARRLSWGVADQGLSSATNLALSILVAHAVGVRAFGVFGLAFATYTFALGVTRSLCSEPLAVRFSSSGDRAWRTAARSSTGTVLALSIPMGAACVAVGTIANSSTGDAFVALGICLPGLVLQDAWRMAFFSNGRGRRAFVNDLVWAVIQIPAMLVALSIGVHSASPLILCWGVAATVAAVYGVVQSRVIPEPGQAAFWLGHTVTSRHGTSSSFWPAMAPMPGRSTSRRWWPGWRPRAPFGQVRCCWALSTSSTSDSPAWPCTKQCASASSRGGCGEWRCCWVPESPSCPWPGVG